jgi:hypothetical protein
MLFSKPIKPQKHLSKYRWRKIIAWYDAHRKLAFKALVTLEILAGVLLVLGFIPYSLDSITHKIETICEKIIVDKCTIRKTTIRPWLGITLDDVSFYKNNNGMSILITVPKIKVTYHIIPFIFKYAIVKNIILEKPRILVSVPEYANQIKSRNLKTPSVDIAGQFKDIPFTVVVRAATLRNAELVLQQKDNVMLHADNMSGSMKIHMKKDLTADGSLSIPKMQCDGFWNITDMHCQYAIHNNDLSVKKCRGLFYGGSISLRADIDLLESMLNNASIEVARVDLATAYEASGINQGTCLGKLDGSMDFSPSALATNSCNGTGQFAMSGVVIKDLPLQNNLILLLSIPKLKQLTFSKITTQCILKNSTLFTNAIRGSGDPLSLNGEGHIMFNGYFNERMECVLQPDLVTTLPSLITKSLDDNENGSKSFHCAVSGTFKNPKLVLDQKIVNRAVSNIFQSIGDFFTKKKK